MRKRQLILPGLKPGKPERRARARRDWSDAEFKRALERNGFEHAGGLRIADVSGQTNLIFIAIVGRWRPVRIARRATLAKILREREASTRSKIECPADAQNQRAQHGAGRGTEGNPIAAKQSKHRAGGDEQQRELEPFFQIVSP